ncbi:MAG TPA: hypothetical protein VFL94_06870 [Actinomycetales bacterium]|nr:hypothetical protein [Actinomycetales bacterium]
MRCQAAEESVLDELDGELLLAAVAPAFAAPSLLLLELPSDEGAPVEEASDEVLDPERESVR